EVSFETNGGSAVSQQSVPYQEKVSEPEAPERKGYTFAGWYTDETYETVWDFEEDVVTEDTKLYAKWKISNYEVSFETNGGSAVSQQSVPYQEKVNEPEAPERTGYTFAGWYTDETYETVWDFEEDVVTEDTTLYAKWLSNNTTLQSIDTSVAILNPQFSKDHTEYTIRVASEVEEIKLKAEASSPKATVRINNTTFEENRTIQLETGINHININVEAEDGSTSEYKVQVIRLTNQYKTIPEVSDGKLTISNQAIDMLDTNGTLILDVLDDLDRVEEIELQAEQVKQLKELNASLAIHKKNVNLNIPISNFNEWKNLSISIKNLSNNLDTDIPNTDLAVSDVLDFTIRQQDTVISEFNKEITISFPIKEQKNMDDLHIFYFNEDTNEWEMIGGTLSDGHISTTTNHFSIYTVALNDLLVEDGETHKENSGQDIDETPDGVTREDNEEIAGTNQEDYDQKNDTIHINLPNTSTNIFNWIVLSMIFLIGGIFILFRFCRKVN
ncbi:cadherin-like beta sandwich domain-containing protein, partial [Gracilibacillus suaedae]|uniref:cadherin-like beta sandwich domain-containing protein n=1 Tax=Gracilibacillus suaedae TaxID=2820273 RepID=UPI001ABE40E0